VGCVLNFGLEAVFDYSVAVAALSISLGLPYQCEGFREGVSGETGGLYFLPRFLFGWVWGWLPEFWVAENVASGVFSARSGVPSVPMGCFPLAGQDESLSGPYVPCVYVASRLQYASMWRSYREGWATSVRVTSRWLDVVGEVSDKGGLWQGLMADIVRSDVLLAYGEAGEVWQGALVEVGAALALGKPVLVVGAGVNSFWSHPLVTRFDTVEAAMASLGVQRPLSPAPITESVRVMVMSEVRHVGMWRECVASQPPGVSIVSRWLDDVAVGDTVRMWLEYLEDTKRAQAVILYGGFDDDALWERQLVRVAVHVALLAKKPVYVVGSGSGSENLGIGASPLVRLCASVEEAFRLAAVLSSP